MSRIVESSFARYEFTPEEEQAAGSFTELQRQYLINERTIWFEKKMQINAEDATTFMHEHIHCQGAIAAIDHILAQNEENRSDIAYQIEENIRAGLEDKYAGKYEEMVAEFQRAAKQQQTPSEE